MIIINVILIISMKLITITAVASISTYLTLSVILTYIRKTIYCCNLSNWLRLGRLRLKSHTFELTLWRVVKLE